MRALATLMVIGTVLLAVGTYKRTKAEDGFASASALIANTCGESEKCETANEIRYMYNEAPKGSWYLGLGGLILLVGGIGCGLIYGDRKDKEHKILMQDMQDMRGASE